MKFTQGSGKDFENPEPGTYPAVCIRVLDMGTQQSVWEGETKSARKVKLVFELDEKMKDGRPFMAMRDFTASMHDKSAFKKFLTGWRGADMSPTQIMEFDPKTLIGKGCLLSMIQNGEYVNVGNASKLPKGMTAPTQVNESIYLDLDAFDQKEFDKLSEKIQTKIALSPEYSAAVGGKQQSSPQHTGSGFNDMSDDIPF